MRSAVRGMWDYMHRFIDEDVAYLNADNTAMRGHPLEDFHSFIGFPEIMRLEQDYLPANEIGTKYDGALGYHPDAKSRQSVQIA